MSNSLERLEEQVAQLNFEVSELTDFPGEDAPSEEPQDKVVVDENFNFFTTPWDGNFMSRQGPKMEDLQKCDDERVKDMLNCFEPFRSRPYIMIANPFSGRLETWLLRNPDKAIYTTGSFMTTLKIKKSSEINVISNMIYQLGDGVYLVRYLSSRSSTDMLVFVKSEKEPYTPWTMEHVNSFFKSFSKELKEMDKYVELGKIKEDAFDRLILPEDLVSDIRADVELFLKSRKMYKEELQLPWKRGYMLIGAPGCGKSLTIKCLCKYWGLDYLDIKHAIRNDGSISLNTGRSDKIDTYYYPDEIRPTVFVMEDIDKFVSFQAGEKHRDSSSVSLHDLLKAMDGIEEYSDAIVIATTNYPNQLSEALINRPGRFDRIWEIKKPTPDNVARFFKMRKIEFEGITAEEVIAGLGEVNMAFVEEFVKSLKMTYKKSLFDKAEVTKVITRINDHTRYCEKIFGNGPKSLGFGA